MSLDLSALLRDDAVHRDVYTSPAVFDAEMKTLFARAWVYVGHASQVAAAGDYITTTIGVAPVVMVRHSDASIRVLHNRCPHKGTRVANDACGNTGRFFRCPYHAWSFRTDGSLAAVPLAGGYGETGFRQSDAARGMTPVGAVQVYRDFVFCRLAPEGIGFEDYFGPSLSSLDNMVDRAPAGRLEVAGGVLRYMHRCNWKMLVENLTDTCHPMVAHESSAGIAVQIGRSLPEGVRHPAVEIYAPFMSPYQFYETMGIQVWPNGHGHTGVAGSIHSNYSAIPGYYEQMVAGPWRGAGARNSRHQPAQHRVFPQHDDEGADPGAAHLQADRRRSHAGGILDLPPGRRAGPIAGAHAAVQPADQRADLGGRHDDLEMYERAQDSLQSDANPWVNMQRLHDARETADDDAVDNGTTERQMRNQFRAWARFMASVTPAAFIRHEARLIDEQRFDEWLDLFTEDARYWMPLELGQTDPILHNNLYYDDKILLRIRVERLKSAKTYSQKPKSRCHHLLQEPVIEAQSDHAAQGWTPFHYVETRLDEQTLYAGWARHSLLRQDGAWRIRLKRIDLVNCDSAFGNIQLFM